jgi:VIT1/CCC1 family predicted Fe2+/Mn2+ transporter
MIAGVAGLLAGAFSMGSGEYVSVRSQNESMRAEVEVERLELEDNPEAELAELTQIYIDKGVDPELAQLVAEQLSVDPKQALQIHAQEELGVDIHDLPNPWLASGSSFLSFSLGALLPVLPFLFGADVLWLAAILTLTGLFVTGAITARFTTRPWYYAGARQLLLGAVTFAITYGIGHLIGANVA